MALHLRFAPSTRDIQGAFFNIVVFESFTVDKKLETRNTQKVLRRLSRRLVPLGFQKSTATCYVRPKTYVAEFILLHKFSFSRHFRVHFGIRVFNDASLHLALNGPDSDAYGRPDSPNGKKYDFYFHIADETIDRCVENILRFCIEVGDPWFKEWASESILITAASSPLHEIEKQALAEALGGRANEVGISNTKRIFHLV